MKTKLILLFVLATSFIQAQNTLSGRVLSSENNEPVGFANVYFPELEKGSVTNDNGEFTIDNLPDGKYHLVVTLLGFKTYSEEIDTKTTHTIEIQLLPSAIEIDEVILSTPFNQLQSDNVMKVESIKLNQDKGDANKNLTDKLAEIPGVNTVSTGNGIGKPVIRGISGNRVLTYTQGIRLENFQSGEKHGLGINESGIESAEVIKGPASLLYGSDALGGVIYLVPEKYEQDDKTSLSFNSAYLSNSIGFNNSIGIKSTSNNIKSLARFTYNTQSDYKTPDDTRVTNSRFNNADIKLGLGFDTKKLTTDIRYNYNHANNGITHDIEEQTTSKNMEGIYQKLDNHYLSVKNNVFLNKLTIKSTLGFTSHNRSLYNGNLEGINMLLNTLNYHVKFNIPKAKKFKTVFGIQGMNQTNRNKADNAFLPDANIFDFGVFGTTNFDINDNSVLQFGARMDTRNLDTDTFTTTDNTVLFDNVSKNYTNFSSSLGFKSNIKKVVDYRINLALGYRAPNLSELFSNGIHEGKFEIGNPNLDTESNFQTDISLEYENTNFELFANIFYNKIANYIYLLPTGTEQNSLPVFQYQQDNSTLYGGEFGVHYHPTSFDWLGFKSSGEYVRGKIDSGDNLPRIPGFTNKNEINFDFNIKNLNNSFISINNTNVFKQKDINEDETYGEAYQVFNISLGSGLKSNNSTLNFTFSVDNIFNQEYVDHLSVLKEVNIPNMGRSFNVSVSYKI